MRFRAAVLAMACALALSGCSVGAEEPKVPEGTSMAAYETGADALEYARSAIEDGSIVEQESAEALGDYLSAVPDDYEEYPNDENVSMAIATICGGATNGDADMASQGADLLEMALDGELG